MRDGSAIDDKPGPGAAAGVPDETLAADAAAGDAVALEALYRRHGGACYGLARRIVVDEQLAQDVVQEVFLALWHRSRHNAGRGSVSTWLLTITHHKAVDLVRREHRRRSRGTTIDALDDAEAPEPASDDLALANLRAAEVRSAMAELPAEQREVLLLAYYGGYTQREISAMTGVALGTVKTRTMAAMHKLRAALPKEAGR